LTPSAWVFPLALLAPPLTGLILGISRGLTRAAEGVFDKAAKMGLAELRIGWRFGSVSLVLVVLAFGMEIQGSDLSTIWSQVRACAPFALAVAMGPPASLAALAVTLGTVIRVAVTSVANGLHRRSRRDRETGRAGTEG
jgi:hypothetical protein